MPSLHPITISEWATVKHDTGDEGAWTFFDVEIAPGESVIVDSLIGQVNGRPIYADEVLGPIVDQLNAEYASLPWREFQGVLIRLVRTQLQELILNELYLSEARAGLSADEQTGLRKWILFCSADT